MAERVVAEGNTIEGERPKKSTKGKENVRRSLLQFHCPPSAIYVIVGNRELEIQLGKSRTSSLKLWDSR